jgi:hypothetical protein
MAPKTTSVPRHLNAGKMPLRNGTKTLQRYLTSISALAANDLQRPLDKHLRVAEMIWFAAMCGLLLGTAASCTQQERERPMNKALVIAQDPKAYIYDRITAASQLDEDEKAKLRSQLLGKLPGHWDVDSLSAIVLLGEVGNSDTVSRLQALSEKNDPPGKIRTAIFEAVKKIQHRTTDLKKGKH